MDVVNHKAEVGQAGVGHPGPGFTWAACLRAHPRSPRTCRTVVDKGVQTAMTPACSFGDGEPEAPKKDDLEEVWGGFAATPTAPAQRGQGAGGQAVPNSTVVGSCEHCLPRTRVGGSRSPGWEIS